MMMRNFFKDSIDWDTEASGKSSLNGKFIETNYQLSNISKLIVDSDIHLNLIQVLKFLYTDFVIVQSELTQL